MKFIEIDPKKLERDQRARMTLEHPAMLELVADVRERGIRTPIIVRPALRGRYVVEDGHRRLDAALACGLEFVPCVVRESADVSATEDQARHALQRAGITAAESARIVAALRAEGRSQDDVARICGRTQSWVSYCETIARLPDEILEHDARVGEIGYARLRQWARAEAERPGAAEEAFREFLDPASSTRSARSSDPDAKLLRACRDYMRAVPPPQWPMALSALVAEIDPEHEPAKKAPAKAAKKEPAKAAKKAPAKAAKKAPAKAAKKAPAKAAKKARAR